MTNNTWTETGITWNNAPEVISGHGPAGQPSTKPHLAYVPLPDVGHEHADGHLLGVAVLVPSRLDDSETRKCIAAIAAAMNGSLVMGRIGAWTVESEPPNEPSRKALDPLSWTRASRRWATVTPIVLDQFPKAEGDAEAVIALACERLGLPRPRDVLAMPVSPVLGVPAAREFPAEPPREGKPKRWHTHAVISFDEEVAGPVVVGAGRYQGYGFCRPHPGVVL